MYTPSPHSFAAEACFVIEADVVAGILRNLIFMLFGQVSVPISEVLSSRSAEENGPKA
jgi:hypothetical protein